MVVDHKDWCRGQTSSLLAFVLSLTMCILKAIFSHSMIVTCSYVHEPNLNYGDFRKILKFVKVQ